MLNACRCVSHDLIAVRACLDMRALIWQAGRQSNSRCSCSTLVKSAFNFTTSWRFQLMRSHQHTWVNTFLGLNDWPVVRKWVRNRARPINMLKKTDEYKQILLSAGRNPKIMYSVIRGKPWTFNIDRHGHLSCLYMCTPVHNLTCKVNTFYNLTSTKLMWIKWPLKMSTFHQYYEVRFTCLMVGPDQLAEGLTKGNPDSDLANHLVWKWITIQRRQTKILTHWLFFFSRWWTSGGVGGAGGGSTIITSCCHNDGSNQKENASSESNESMEWQDTINIALESFFLTAAYDKPRHPNVSLDTVNRGLWGISLDDAFA